MRKLLLATSNSGKIQEYCYLLAGIDYQITTPAEEGILKTITESGSNYEQNARLKAVTYAKLSQLVVLADDSGLEVDALNGAPGIKSARFAGESATDADKVTFLLSKLESVPPEKLTACFKCVIAIANPKGYVELCHGECHGIITGVPKGENGFGYDPIFFFPELSKTMAELSFEIKNQISHRARASQKTRQILQQINF